MSTLCEINLPPVAPDRLRALLALTGLSESAAARELGVDDQAVRDWCTGRREAPRMALYALEYLAALRSTDNDAVSAACRLAAVQARINANRLPDPRPALALITIAEIYERMAKRQAPAEAPAAVATPKKDLPRPS